MSTTPEALMREETAGGGALRRFWPVLTNVAGWVLVAALILGKLAALAGLVSNAMAFGCTLLVIAGVAVLIPVQYGLVRLRLIDAPKPTPPLMTENHIPVHRPPPPINDEAPTIAKSPDAVLPSRSTLPGGTAHWGLEGGYAWRPHEEEVG